MARPQPTSAQIHPEERVVIRKRCGQDAIRGKRRDSLFSKKYASYGYVANTRTKLFHA